MKQYNFIFLARKAEDGIGVQWKVMELTENKLKFKEN